MSNGRFLSCLAVLALLRVLSAASHSASVSAREDKDNIAIAFDAEQERVSDLVSIGNGFYLQRSQHEFGIRAHGVVERTASGSAVSDWLRYAVWL